MSNKNKSMLSKRIASFLAAGILSCNLAYANPTGMQVQAGAAIAANPNANTLAVTIGANGTVINWNSFSIAAGETTAFTAGQSLSGSYAVLNRVVGADLSTIAGTLTSDRGQIFLVNQNGIAMAGGAVINAPLFVASTLNMTNEAFQNYVSSGAMVFDQAVNTNNINGGASGAVTVNGPQSYGASNVALLGNTVLIAPGVTFTDTTTGGLNIIAATKVRHDSTNELAYSATAANTLQVGDNTNGASLRAGSVILAGGAVDIRGISGNNGANNSKITADSDLSILALNELGAGYAAASADNSINVAYSQITAGRSGQRAAMQLLGGSIALDHTKLQANGHWQNSINLGSITQSSNSESEDNSEQHTAQTGNGNTITLTNSNLLSPDMTIYGNTITADHTDFTINDYFGVYAGTAIAGVEAPINSGTATETTMTMSATADNTVTISNSKVIATAFDAQHDLKQDVAVIGGAVALSNVRVKDRNQDLNASYLDGNAELLVIAGNSTSYVFRDHSLRNSSILYEGNKNNLLAIGTTEAPVTLMGRNVTAIGGAVALQGGSNKTALLAHEDVSGNGNITVLSGQSYSVAGLATTADNTVTLNHVHMNTTSIDSGGSDILVAGGKVSGSGNDLTAASGIELYAVKSVITTNSSEQQKPITADMDAGKVEITTENGNDLNLTQTALSGDNGVSAVGSTVTLSGTITANDNSSVNLYAATTLKNEFDQQGEALRLTATKDNTLTIGSETVPTTISAGSVQALGGAIQVIGSTNTATAITGSSDVIMVAATARNPGSFSATTDNKLSINYGNITVNSNATSDTGISLFGGKVDIKNSQLITNGWREQDLFQNPTSITIGAFKQAEHEEHAADSQAIATWSLTMEAGNDTTISQTTFSAPDVDFYGNTVRIGNAQITASDYIGMFAGNAMYNTETASLSDPGADKTETYRLTGTAANALEVTNSTLTMVVAADEHDRTADTQLVGGTVSLVNTNVSDATNGSGNVFVVAGNQADYAYIGHNLTGGSVVNYEGTKANAVTIGSIIGPTAINGANVAIFGGAVTVGTGSSLSGENTAVNASNNIIADSTARTLTMTGSIDNSIVNDGTISGTGGPILNAGGTIANTGTIRGGAGTTSLIAWGEATNTGTLDAPSYFVLSGNTVTDKSDNISTSTNNNDLLTVTAGSAKYEVTTGAAATVTAIATVEAGGPVLRISGQTKSNPAVPEGKPDDQAVIQAYQTTMTTTLSGTTSSAGQPGSSTVSLPPQMTGGGAGPLLTGTGSPPPFSAPTGGVAVEVSPGISFAAPGGLAGPQSNGPDTNSPAGVQGSSPAIPGPGDADRQQ